MSQLIPTYVFDIIDSPIGFAGRGPLSKHVPLPTQPRGKPTVCPLLVPLKDPLTGLAVHSSKQDTLSSVLRLLLHESSRN